MKAFKLIAGAVMAFFACIAILLMLAILGTSESSAEDPCPTRSITPTALVGNQIPADLMPIYQAAEEEYDVPWSVLAAINRIETNFGQNLNTSSAGAKGWMQFMPATWLAYGVDANGDGVANTNDPKDAIFAAANYLSASGAPEQMRKAIFAYNHANWYVDDVLAFAKKYDRSFTLVDGAAAGFGTCKPDDEVPIGDADAESVQTAAEMLHRMRVPYNYGGGHVTPAKPTGGQQGSYAGLDCSSAVSWVLQHAGIEVPTMVSGNYMTWGEAGPGKFVTIYANAGHIFMKIGDRYFGTSGFGHPPFTGAAWFTRNPSSGYLATFVQRHPPGM